MTAAVRHPGIVPSRGNLVLVVLLGLFLLLGLRALQLVTTRADFLQEEGNARTMRVVEVNATRGVIRDRHGAPLAVSTPLKSLWVSRNRLRVEELRQKDPGRLAALAEVLEMEPDQLEQRLDRPGQSYFYLRRQLRPDVAERVAALGIPGLELRDEYRRYYPDGEVTAHVVGFTDIDDQGQEGLELAFDERLTGTPGQHRVVRDARGDIIEHVERMREPENGRDLHLSIDRSIQYLAYRALSSAMAEHRARAGAVVVLDARTGEVLAMVNQPSFNPNNRASIQPGTFRNRAVVDVYEPGSTLKPFTVAAALEAGRVRPDSRFDTGNGTMTIGGRTIRDVHAGGVMTVREIIQKSSNVGSARIALDLAPSYLWETFDALGFGRLPELGYPGEVAGVLRDHRRWRPIEQATMAYGHGISLSLLQLARAYTVFANGGALLPVSLLRREDVPERRQVFSPATALTMLEMLDMAAGPGGTAPRARVPGYRVGGKTGTAHKLEHGRYVDKYVSSFVGIAPVSDPRLIVAVMIDEPSAGRHYGGAVAAPVFAEVAGAALRLMNVPPDAPEEVEFDWRSMPVVGEST